MSVSWQAAQAVLEEVEPETKDAARAFGGLWLAWRFGRARRSD